METGGAYTSSPSRANASSMRTHHSSRWESRSLDQPNYPSIPSLTSDDSLTGDAGIVEMTLPTSEMALMERSKTGMSSG